nr:hypothetical protein [Clostridia bacterium]
MRYLITQSLLSAWNYVHSCYEGCEEDAMASFLSTLRREPSEVTEAMQNGIEFEDEVYAQASGQLRPPHPKWERGICEVAALLSGAQFQVRVQRELTIDGMTFLVYGVLDALQAGTIYDVKFKNKSFGSVDLAGEYFNSPQHPFYFYLVPEALKFRYLVSDGQDLYIEEYRPDETKDAGELIREFVAFLKASDLLDTYKQFWAARE